MKYTNVRAMLFHRYCGLMKHISPEQWKIVMELQADRGWHPAKGCYLLPEMQIGRKALQSYINLSDDPDGLRKEIREMERLGLIERIRTTIRLTEAGFDELDRQFTIRRDTIR